MGLLIPFKLNLNRAACTLHTINGLNIEQLNFCGIKDGYDQCDQIGRFIGLWSTF